MLQFPTICILLFIFTGYFTRSSRSVDITSEESIEVFSVIPLQNGGLVLIASNMEDYERSSERDTFILIRVSESGTMIWNRKYTLHSFYNKEDEAFFYLGNLLFAAEDNENEFIVSMPVRIKENSGFFFGKFDIEGELINEKFFLPNYEIEQEIHGYFSQSLTKKLEYDADGGYIVLLSSYDVSVFIRISDDLELIWSKKLFIIREKFLVRTESEKQKIQSPVESFYEIKNAEDEDESLILFSYRVKESMTTTTTTDEIEGKKREKSEEEFELYQLRIVFLSSKDGSIERVIPKKYSVSSKFNDGVVSERKWDAYEDEETLNDSIQAHGCHSRYYFPLNNMILLEEDNDSKMIFLDDYFVGKISLTTGRIYWRKIIWKKDSFSIHSSIKPRMMILDLNKEKKRIIFGGTIGFGNLGAEQVGKLKRGDYIYLIELDYDGNVLSRMVSENIGENNTFVSGYRRRKTTGNDFLTIIQNRYVYPHKLVFSKMSKLPIPTYPERVEKNIILNLDISGKPSDEDQCAMNKDSEMYNSREKEELLSIFLEDQFILMKDDEEFDQKEVEDLLSDLTFRTDFWDGLRKIKEKKSGKEIYFRESDLCLKGESEFIESSIFDITIDSIGCVDDVRM